MTFGILGSPYLSYSTSASGVPDTTVKCGNSGVFAIPESGRTAAHKADALGEFNHVDASTNCLAGPPGRIARRLSSGSMPRLN